VRFAVAVPVRLLAALAVVALVVAPIEGCSSSTPAASGSDAGDEYRALGESCDPTSPHPCEVLTDGCSAAVCQSNVCVRVFVDAGPTCSNGSPPSYDAGSADAGQGSDAALADAGGDASVADASAGDASASGDAAVDASDASTTDASFDASGD
jgi:hypothetical protein